ncbi:MAG: hypothetical protein Q9160_006895 [Pyrenula sp. 1 TL-2023]
MAKAPPPRPPLLPHIHLLCQHASSSTAFQLALSTHPLPLSYTIHTTSLSALSPRTTHFDLIVSPANSHGILDGGFDDAISRTLSPKDDYFALTRAVQAQLYRTHRGFLPPGGCEIVRIPDEVRGRGRYYDGKGWGCGFVGVCPTMRTPGDVRWDREVVYECVWSLLCGIGRHNEGKEAGERIEEVLMTPLGTGTGGVSEERWAEQAVLALKHYVEAGEDEEKWTRLGWKEALELAQEARETWKD